MTLPALRVRPREQGQSLTSAHSHPAATKALLEAILPVTSVQFGVPVQALRSKRRQQELVRARAFVVWALRSLGEPLSYPLIGDFLGGRDHTSMIYLHEKAERLRLSDGEFRGACDRIAAAFNQFEETPHGGTRH